MPPGRTHWTRRLSAAVARLGRAWAARGGDDLPAPRRHLTARWAAGALAALALGITVDTATAHNPTWAAAVINTGHAIGLYPYRAVPFRREGLVPYTAVTVNDPNLPVGMHQVRQPGLTGTVVTTGIALYRTPVPRATPAPTRTPRSGAASIQGTSRGPVSSVARTPQASAAAAPGRATSASPVTSSPEGQSPVPVPTPAPAEVKVLSSTVIAAPRQAVIAVGTSQTCIPVNGRCYTFSHVLDMAATAYDATFASNGAWTGQRSAIGLPLDYGIVAVDPHVIPLGSRLYVENYGLAIAADTGSAIVGDHIDLFFWDTPRDIAAFGIRHLKVYILDDPRLKPLPVPRAIQNALG